MDKFLIQRHFSRREVDRVRFARRSSVGAASAGLTAVPGGAARARPRVVERDAGDDSAVASIARAAWQRPVPAGRSTAVLRVAGVMYIAARAVAPAAVAEPHPRRQIAPVVVVLLALERVHD